MKLMKAVLMVLAFVQISLNLQAQEESLSDARARNFAIEQSKSINPSDVVKELRKIQMDSDLQFVQTLVAALVDPRVTDFQKNIKIDEAIRSGLLRRFLNNRLAEEQDQIQYIKSELRKTKIAEKSVVIVGFTGIAITVSALVETYIPQRFNLGLLTKPIQAIKTTMIEKYGLKTTTIVKNAAVVAGAYAGASSVKWLCVHWYDVDRLEKALDLAERRLLADKRAADVMLEDAALGFLKPEAKVDWVLSTIKSF